MNRAREDQVDVGKIRALMSSQHKTHREPSQGGYGVAQVGGGLEVGDRHLRAPRHEVPRQPDRATEESQSHDRDALAGEGHRVHGVRLRCGIWREVRC
jgi:hypothetical protein